MRADVQLDLRTGCAAPDAAVSTSDWARLLKEHAAGRCIVPSWEEADGWTDVRVGLEERGTLTGGAVVSFRKIPMLPYSIARVTCLMVPRDLRGRPIYGEPLARLLKLVERTCRERRALEIELHLRLPESGELSTRHDHVGLKRKLAACGYHPIGASDHGYVVRIDRDDEALLLSFELSARNVILRSYKRGTTVIRATSSRFLEELFPARAPTIERLAPLVSSGMAMVFIERDKTQLLDVAVVDALGLPCCALAVRTAMEAGAGQRLQYEIMRYLRNKGAKYYDLGSESALCGREFAGENIRFLPDYRKYLEAGWCLELAHMLRGDPV